MTQHDNNLYRLILATIKRVTKCAEDDDCRDCAGRLPADSSVRTGSMSPRPVVTFSGTPATNGPAHRDHPVSDLAPDCRHFRGDRPCVHNRLCGGCPHFQPYSHRICVIKTAALGDVIRTLCILPELRRRYPMAHVTWVSKPSGCRMLRDHPLIDRLMPLDSMTWLVLGCESFDTVINLDKEPGPCALAMSVRAAQRLGVGLSEHGTPVPLNAEAHAYFHLGLNDDLKFRQNTKSYPHLIYEALGWEYQRQRYELVVNPAARSRIRFHLASRRWQSTKPTLGINVGAGSVFANKMWPAPRIVDVIRLVQDRHRDVQIVLLGGSDERPLINAILARLRAVDALDRVIDSGTDHDEPSFVAMVDTCNVVFTGDTMAMHVAVALNKHIVAVFGPTCEQEIDLYGKGQKLVARVDCAPCYKRICDHDSVCAFQIDAAEAAQAITQTICRATGMTARPPASPVRLAG